MVNIYKQEFTVLQQEIIRLLFIKAGKTLNARRIAQHLNVSSTAVLKAIERLDKVEFIKVSKDKESKRFSIELNRDNPKVVQFKRADNLKQIYESGLADFLEKEFAGAVIILFGSYSRGEDTLDSDIDIAIIGRKDKKIDLSKFEEMLQKEIITNFYDSFSHIHKNLKDNLFNGIVLVGAIES